MGWGSILHNALNDAKGLVDPRNYAPIVKATVEADMGHPGDAFKLAKGMGKSYVKLAEHPIREFQNHPLDTALSVIPWGKAADLGAAGALTRVLKTGPEVRIASAAKIMDRTSAALPGARAAKAAGILTKDFKQRATAYRYDPGDGIPRHPFSGTVPGAQVNVNILKQLHADLGHPNASHGVEYQPVDNPNIAGFFSHKTQDAKTYLTPNHLLRDSKFPGVTKGAERDLTQTMLHEARHAYQAANWPLSKRVIDSYRSYGNRRGERDANQFMESQAHKYQGLVKADPFNPNVRPDIQATVEQRMGEASGSGVDQLHTMLDDLQKGEPGLTPDRVLSHMDELVRSGELSPQEAMDIEARLDGHFRQGSYQPPKSAQELFARAVEQAKLGRKTPTFNGGKAAGIRNSFNEPTQWGQAR